jgi:hypothetical protein
MSNAAHILLRVNGLIAEARTATKALEGMPSLAISNVQHALEQLTEAVELLARLATEPLSDQEALTLVPGATRAVEPAGYCCERMRGECTNTCDQHAVRLECPDALIVQNGSVFGIMVHDGGESYIGIDFCPWCGTSLYAAANPGAVEPSAPEPAPAADVPSFDWDLSFVGSL